ncbi:MAG: pseudouridine synthase [Anditalea sp.]
MRRNNKDNKGYGKASGKSGNYKPSPRNERSERDNKPSSNRFFGERDERPGKTGKPSFNKPKTDGGNNSERSHKPTSNQYGRGRSDRSRQEGKPSYNKFGAERGERSEFGSKPPFKKYGSEGAEKADGTAYKTIYKGRGKDQKPRYETVRKEEADYKRTPKKFFPNKRLLDNGPNEQKPSYDFKKFEKRVKINSGDEEIRLNKYIANSGVCSRREADSLIENGLISVNGKLIKELGHKVFKKDKVQYQGKTLNPEKPVYVLLNKPKDFITTTDDPMERKTVMSLVSSACDERIFPVGRLDRNTTGLLLFTNDGELADKLASPANKIKKIYQVTLDKPLTKNDADAIVEGLTLEDGLVKVDDMQVLSKDRTILGLEIHIGRNRIVRRTFAHLGYDVVSLDRVVYAGLTKKDVSRGNYRFLSEKEVINLKFFS